MKTLPCTVYRPDANGNLVPVCVQRPVRQPAAIRPGPFVVWDDMCQATRAGDTLAACAEYLAVAGGDDEVVFFANAVPAPLNRAERAELRRILQEGSE